MPHVGAAGPDAAGFPPGPVPATEGAELRFRTCRRERADANVPARMSRRAACRRMRVQSRAAPVRVGSSRHRRHRAASVRRCAPACGASVAASSGRWSASLPGPHRGSSISSGAAWAAHDCRWLHLGARRRSSGWPMSTVCACRARIRSAPAPRLVHASPRRASASCADRRPHQAPREMLERSGWCAADAAQQRALRIVIGRGGVGAAHAG